MTKQIFLNRLGQLLADVSAEERAEALRYYEEYFAEAGPEQEQALLAELGSPEKVAAIIRTNVPGSRPAGPAAAQAAVPPQNEGEGADEPESDRSAGESAPPPVSRYIRGLGEGEAPRAPQPPRPEAGAGAQARPAPEKGENRTLWLVLMIATSPGWVSLLIALAGVVAGLAGGLLGLILGLIGAVFGLILAGFISAVAGVASLGVSLPLLGSALPDGLVALAAGLLCCGVGLLLLSAGVSLVRRAVPAAWRWCLQACRAMGGWLAAAWRGITQMGRGGK